MSPWTLVAALSACVFASALYSGAEIGFYSISRARVDLEARRGGRTARLVARLLENDAALLVTLLIGNNLAIELSTHLADSFASESGLSPRLRELVLMLVLTPTLFLLAEVLPKDLFRRRPHTLVALVAPFIVVSRVAFWPLERLLSLLSTLLQRVFGLDTQAAARYHGRERVLDFLAEGKRSGALSPRAEVLARNALELGSIQLRSVMRPWEEVERLERGSGREAQLAAVCASSFSRLPVVDEAGVALGYVHQLDVLLAGTEGAVLDHLRPLPSMSPQLPVARALTRLRASGQRIAVVGGPEAPLGVVTLKDLVEEISGDLPAW